MHYLVSGYSRPAFATEATRVLKTWGREHVTNVRAEGTTVSFEAPILTHDLVRSIAFTGGRVELVVPRAPSARRLSTYFFAAASVFQ